MGLQTWVVDALFRSPKFLEYMAGIFKITRALIPKRKGWALPHHKVGLAEEVSRKWAQVVWPIIPRQIMLIPRAECKKVVLWYQSQFIFVPYVEC